MLSHYAVFQPGLVVFLRGGLLVKWFSSWRATASGEFFYTLFNVILAVYVDITMKAAKENEVVTAEQYSR